jgi:hypothetical protein
MSFYYKTYDISNIFVKNATSSYSTTNFFINTNDLGYPYLTNMTPSTRRETIGAYSVANFGSQNIIKLRNTDNGTVNYGFTCDGYIGNNNLSFYVSVKPTYNNFTIDSLGSGGSLSCTVSAIAVGVNGSIYAGGNFTSMGGAPNTRGIAKWDGSSWSALGTGAQDGSVLAIAVSLDGSIYAGGTFTSIGGVAANYIAKWNGSSWSALGTGAAGGYGRQAIVSALAVGLDGYIYAGGWFPLMGGVANTINIAKWNGSSWSALVVGTNDSISSLTVSSNGQYVYAGGDFTSATPYNAGRVAKWDTALNVLSWSPVGLGTNNRVFALAVGLDGCVYAGGAFISIGGVAANYIAKWNGSIWSVLGTGANNCVRALAVGIDGSIYAGGDFTSIGGVAANRIAKWDGSSWSALGNGGDSAVHALAVGLDGCVYAGGDFTLMNGVANTRCVAKINNTFTWSLL